MSYMEIKTEIKKVIQIQCPICYREYNDQDVIPMLICFGQHSVCKQCLNKTFDMLNYDEPANCPICNEEFSEEYTTKFRLMGEVIQMTKYFENYCEVKAQEFDALKQQNHELSMQLTNQKILYEMKKQELIEVKRQIKKLSRSKSKDKKQNIDSKYYLKVNKGTKNDSKYGQSHSFYSKIDKKRKQTVEQTLMPNSDGFDEINQILKPKLMQKIKETIPNNQRYYRYQQQYKNKRNKANSIFVGKSKLSLPYFISTTCVTSTQIHQLKKSEKPDLKLSVRQSCIDVLRRYNFSKVYELNLSNLDFTETYFEPLSFLHSFFSLHIINLSKNRINRLPQFIFELKNLRELNLNHNNLSKLAPEISLLRHLQKLLLWNNKLIFLPEQLCQLTHLHEIQVSNNKITVVPSFLCFIRKLKKIGLFGNPINWTEVSYQIVSDLRSKEISVELE